MKLELSLLEQKLDVAARAMLKRQHDRAIQLFPDKNVKDTDFYKAHVQTISNWKMDKLAPHLSAEEVYARVTADIEDQQLKMLHAMVAAAQQDVEQPDVVDPDLMSELTSLVEDKHGAGDKAGTHMFTINMVCIWSGKFPLGLVHQKRPPQVPKNRIFPAFYERFWDLWGPFLGDQTKWKMCNMIILHQFPSENSKDH